MLNTSSPPAQPSHPDHVSILALSLFDRTHPLHGLGDDSRRTLEAAARLVDQPFPQGKGKKQKIALEMVETLTDQELNPDEKKVLSAVIALQQLKIKKKDLHRFDLSPAQQRETLTITAILRIATGLDNSRSSSSSIHSIEPTRDGMWIIIEGPQAVSDAQTAQHCSRLWAKIGYPPVTVMETAEAAQKLLPFPSPDEKIQFAPTDTVVEAARKVMRYHFAQMLKHEPGTRLGENIEALHDMRVATRRMRAAFEVFKEIFEPGTLKPYLKGLQSTGRSLGAVRDLDVLMEKVGIYLKALPPDHQEDLTQLLNAWASQRQQSRMQMLNFLDSRAYMIFKREFNTFLQTPGAGAQPLPTGQPVPNRVRELVPILVYTRLAAVLAFDPLPADASLEHLHALRIEFKKLRYTVEYFRLVLGSQAEEIIQELKQLQDHLGDLNDANVASNLLEQFIAVPGESSLDAQQHESIHRYLQACIDERERLRSTFPQVWEYFKRSQFRNRLSKAIAAL